MNGILVIDKPSGMTSHDVVAEARQALGMKRIGHAGTLDPLATGVLPLLVGEATKLSPYLTAGDKEYSAILYLGVETDTQDSQGSVLRRFPLDGVDAAAVGDVFSRFRGVIRQAPPAFSAVKVRGKSLYKYAREGSPATAQEREVSIYSLSIVRISFPYVEFLVHCSKGTYIRKLASDIGKELGAGAHLTSLRRTRCGPFTLSDAVSADDMRTRARLGTIHTHLIPMSRALAGMDAIPVTAAEAMSLRHGRPLHRDKGALEEGKTAKVVVKRHPEGDEDLVAIVVGREGAQMGILRVFNP